MVVACLALLVALGGTGYAISNPPPDSVGPLQLRDNAVTNAKIANGVLGETVKTFAKGLVVDFLPHIEQPLRGRGLRKRYRRHVVLLELC